MQETTRDIKSMTIEELAGVMKENGSSSTGGCM